MAGKRRSRFDEFQEHIESRDEAARRRAFLTTQGQVYLAVQAVAQQAHRLRASQSVTHIEHQADAVLFVYALRSVLQLVTSAARLVGETDRALIEAALNRFGEAVPAAVDARDVLAHLDEYILGFGRLQNRGDEAWLPWFSRQGTEYTVRMGEMTIPVDAADDAAHDIAMPVLLASRDGVEEPEGH